MWSKNVKISTIPTTKCPTVSCCQLHTFAELFFKLSHDVFLGDEHLHTKGEVKSLLNGLVHKSIDELVDASCWIGALYCCSDMIPQWLHVLMHFSFYKYPLEEGHPQLVELITRHFRRAI